VGDVILCSLPKLRDLLAEVRDAGFVDIPVLRAGKRTALRLSTGKAQAA
jgi:hypothetical protein